MQELRNTVGMKNDNQTEVFTRWKVH